MPEKFLGAKKEAVPQEAEKWDLVKAASAHGFTELDPKKAYDEVISVPGFTNPDGSVLDGDPTQIFVNKDGQYADSWYLLKILKTDKEKL